MFGDKIYLDAGQSSTFTIHLSSKQISVFVIKAIDSVEVRNFKLNACYWNSVETRELCKTISPTSVQSY
jgi:hypothetical protein